MKQPRPKLLLELIMQQATKQEDLLSSSMNYTQFVLAVMTVTYHTGPIYKS